MSMASATSSSAAEGGARCGGRRWLPGGMRFRIAVSVTAVLVVLIVAQSLALVRLNEEMEEEFIDGKLDEQLHYSIEHSRRLGTLIGPQTPNMTLYRFAPGETPPQGLRPELAALAVGDHEDWSAGRELHVAVREADGQRYVLIYDESEHRERESAVVATVVIGGLVLTALSFLLVYAIAARLTRGLETLAERVEEGRDGEPFAEDGLDAELLVVARALDRAEARQAAVLARERDFNANLSHELRTPLAGIRSDAEMLLIDPALSDKARRRAERIIATTDRTTTLAHSLLLLAREARPQALEPIDLGAAVRQAWARLHPPAAEAEAPSIRIDPGPRSSPTPACWRWCCATCWRTPCAMARGARSRWCWRGVGSRCATADPASARKTRCAASSVSAAAAASRAMDSAWRWCGTSAPPAGGRCAPPTGRTAAPA